MPARDPVSLKNGIYLSMPSNFIAHLVFSACALLVLQTGMVLADQNISSIEQIGSGNALHVTQQAVLDTDNNALVEQSGDDHRAEIEQSGTGLDNDASIFQTGIGHAASVFQDGYGGSNTAIIAQDGETNDARISQHALLFGLNPNVAKVTQSGIGNDADIDQTGNNHEAEIKQNGDHNGGSIEQHDSGQKAYLEQNGDNLAHPTIIQFGSDAAVTVIQTN